MFKVSKLTQREYGPPEPSVSITCLVVVHRPLPYIASPRMQSQTIQILFLFDHDKALSCSSRQITPSPRSISISCGTYHMPGRTEHVLYYMTSTYVLLVRMYCTFCGCAAME